MARYVTARNLSRCTSQVLDHVEGHRSMVVVFRNGLPVAKLSPIDESEGPFHGWQHDEWSKESQAPAGEPDIDDDEARRIEHHLTPDDRRLLSSIAAAYPDRLYVANLGAWIAPCLSTLDLDALIERIDRSYHIRATRLGLRVAEIAQSR